MSHDDLIRKGYGHHKDHKSSLPNMPSEVPSWCVVMLEQQALLIDQVMLLRKEVREMKQSTSDLIAATNDLIANDAAMEGAIDALVAAQADGDDAAVEAQVTALKNLKTNQSTHLAALAAAIPPVVAAPSDPTTVGLNNAPADPAKPAA